MMNFGRMLRKIVPLYDTEVDAVEENAVEENVKSTAGSYSSLPESVSQCDEIHVRK